VYVSTLTSLAIAIDRYFVIVHPFKPRMKLGVCILLIAVVWIVAVSISLPLAIYVKYNSTDTLTTCKVSLASLN
jgi:neuropeptide Y receptor